MKYLNLSEGFNPYLKESIKYEFFVFKGGEPHIKILDPVELGEGVIISIRVNSFNDLGALCVAVDALRRMRVGSIELTIPYFPGARQDRIMIKGEALTCKVYSEIINSLRFKLVTIIDPHSDVAPALINNCNIVNNHRFATKAIKDYVDEKVVHLVSPDAGARKKVQSLSQYIIQRGCWFEDPKGFPKAKGTGVGANTKVLDTIVYADKTRNVSDGSISGFHVHGDYLSGTPCVVVDDICDGGGTFIGLAKALKEKSAGNLYLVVTHGIFSKGFLELRKYYKDIITTNSIYDNNCENTIRISEVL